MIAVPRVVVSAPSSGHGKTAITVGLLAALAARGLNPAGFKVGPDHTDAAYLGMAAGRPGRNLDPRLVGAQRVAPLFAHGAAGAEVAVVEGTMGLFDSLAGRPESDSTAAIATTLRAPVVLVVDVGSMGQSVAALAHGFRAYDEMLWLGGVILNRVASDRHEQLLRDALDDIGVPVFGALRRRDLPSVLPSRQHGVVPVMQLGVEAYRGVRRLGEAIAGAVDLDRLLALARSAPRVSVTAWSAAEALGDLDPSGAGGDAPARRPVVALAGGPALSYSYAETAELLAAAGAEVVTVDPLRDETLPADTGALVIGGALPEAYAEELSANRRLCIAVAELARTGRPVIAEGAGLLWLARELDGRPMCGVLDATGVSLDRTVVGYREATARADTPLARLGARMVGYKHHRAVLTPRAGQTPAWSWGGGPPEGFVWRRVHASQLTLHWASSPAIARRLVAAVASAVPAGQTGPMAPAGSPGGPVQPTSTGPARPGPAGPGPAGPGPAVPAGSSGSSSSSSSPVGAPTPAGAPPPVGSSSSSGPVGPSGPAAPAGAPVRPAPSGPPAPAGAPDPAMSAPPVGPVPTRPAPAPTPAPAPAAFAPVVAPTSGIPARSVSGAPADAVPTSPAGPPAGMVDERVAGDRVAADRVAADRIAADRGAGARVAGPAVAPPSGVPPQSVPLAPSTVSGPGAAPADHGRPPSAGANRTSASGNGSDGTSGEARAESDPAVNVTGAVPSSGPDPMAGSAQSGQPVRPTT